MVNRMKVVISHQFNEDDHVHQTRSTLLILLFELIGFDWPTVCEPNHIHSVFSKSSVCDV